MSAPARKPVDLRTARKPVDLGYTFAPVPHRVEQARKAGTLSEQGEQLLRVLYGAASWHRLAAREECVTLTLAQVRARMPYAGTDDALSKLIRRLRNAGWFAYRVERKRRDHWYTFRLFPDDLPLSEHGPSRVAQPERDSGHYGGDACPSDRPSCPSEIGDEAPAQSAFSPELGSSLVRVPQRTQRTPRLRQTIEPKPGRGREEDEEELFDRFWAETRTRGAYWEPDS